MSLVDGVLRLPTGVGLATRSGGQPVRHGARTTTDRDGPPYLLVHGLASNARVWDGVTRRLEAAGREVVAVDLRGHGRSDRPDDGYDTDTAAADLQALCEQLGWTGDRAPVVAGQSWGGNVVLTLAARYGVPRAIALLDGGWISLGTRFPTFEQCWDVLAPPRFEGVRYDDLAARIRTAHADWPAEGVEGTLANLERLPDGGVRARLPREHHRSILRSLWRDDPRELYPAVRVPTLLMPASAPEGNRATPSTVSAVRAMLAAVPSARVSWYAGADHDLHAQHPQRVTDDLLSLEDAEEETA